MPCWKLRREPRPALKTRHLAGLPASLRRDERGTTAVEFGLIAVPFFGLLLAVLQTGLYFFASEALDVAVQDAARNIYTGTAQTAGVATAAAFSSKYLCPTTGGRKLPSYIDCTQLIIDVRSASSFAATDTTSDIYNATTQFCPGAPGDIVVVRVIYPLPVLIPVLGRTGSSSVGVLRTGMVNNGGWKQILLGTAVFQNEPYDGSSYVAPAGC